MKRFFIAAFLISISAATIYSNDLPKINIRMTVCKRTVLQKVTPYYSGQSSQLEEKEVITIYSDAINSARKDYTAICGPYSEIAEYTLLDGLKVGPYYYYSLVHGGNCEQKITVTGSYKNDQKHGEWIKKSLMDCAGLQGTPFAWINGSHDDRVESYTIYDNGKIIYYVGWALTNNT
ncbi:MAG: hypothetical protein NTY22_05800 [Proteobacteria bacterium]|nr:hypothetical protein [Pseudomonadota bacterium]